MAGRGGRTELLDFNATLAAAELVHDVGNSSL
jgi:hypothetical protein